MKQDLIIPVYLNQRIVFDLVAMLRHGIATVTRVMDTDMDSSSKSGDVGATFGLNKALASLLRIDLSGKASTSKTHEGERVLSEERVHTPASLFFTVRELLLEKSLLVQDSSGFTPRAGEFIEFQAVLNRNPIIETMDAMRQIMEIGNLFSDPKKQFKKGETDTRKLAKQIEDFAEKLRAGDTLDLITPPLECTFRCIATLEVQYLNDPHLSDLVDGTFRVLGKVIRVVHEGEGSVSLIRKSALSRMPKSTLVSAFAGFERLTKTQGFSFPELSWEIEGPVMLVLPVAIFT